MSTRGNNPDPQASRNAARPAAPGPGGLVMLAGSAAGRMVQAILARLSGPYARPAARPLRPAALWQHVARRLGYIPPASTPLGTASSAAPARPPAVDLVWRVRPVAPPDGVVEEIPPFLAPRATPPAFPPARPVSPAAPVAPSSSAGSVLPPRYEPPPPLRSVAPPPGRAAFVPSTPSPPQPFAAPVPAFLMAASAPGAPIQRVPLWEQVTRSPVAPVPPAPPVALARQVAYRMGQDTARPAQPGFTILGPAPVPEIPFVWRTRPVAAQPLTADDTPPAAPAWPRASLPPVAGVPSPPVAGSAVPLPTPAPASPVQRMPAATGSSGAPAGVAPAPSADIAPVAPAALPSSIQVGYTPGPALVPAAPLATAPVLGALAPLPRAAASPPAVAAPPAPVPTRWDQDLVWRVRSAPVREAPAQDEPAPRWSPVAAPVRMDTPAPTPGAMAGAPEPAVVLPRAPVPAPAESAPPAVEAAQHVVRLAYTPPPPHAPLWAGPAANLATELNRDLVAPGDLLVRPVRVWDQEPVAGPSRPAEVATSAPPPEEVTPLAMPLAAPARATTPPEAASGAADLPAANPGLFSRLVDRVTSALPLPEPIRHALESLAARPAEVASAPAPASVSIPAPAPPSAPLAVDSQQPPPAPVEISAPLPAAAGPSAARPIAPLEAPAALPNAPVAAPAPAPPVETRATPTTGGFLSAIVSRLLGETMEPSTPAAGPAPLDMPWARRTAPPAVEPDIIAEVDAAFAPAAPPAAATGVPAPLAAPPAPVTESGAPAPIPPTLAAVDSPQAPPVPAVVDSPQASPAPALVDSPQVPPAVSALNMPVPAASGAAPTETPADLPAAPVAVGPEPALVPTTAAPLVEPRPARGAGGFLSAIVSRLLGGTPEPPAPAAGPAPLAMPWARRTAPPAVEPDIAADFEIAPIPVQRAAAAPVAPPAAAVDAPAPPIATPAPGAESGPSVAMPAIPVPSDQPAAPVAPAWVSTPAVVYDQPAGEIAGALIEQTWMDLDTMADVLARVQTPLVPATALGIAGHDSLWSRILGTFERALPGGGTPGFERAAPPPAPLAYAWSAGSQATAGAIGEPSVPSVPSRPDGYSGQPGATFGPSAAYGPVAAAWAPAGGLGGRAPLAGRSLADFVPALGSRPLAPADSTPAPASYFDAESGADADAAVPDPAQAWIAALDHLYGAPAAGSETMPLAAPYGGFVVPAAGASGVLPQDMAWVAETIGFASAPPAATPARRVWERPAAGSPSPLNRAGAQGPGAIPPLPAPAAPVWIGDTGSDEDDSEAAAWADVVAAAVDSDFGAGMPALALAGEEHGVPAVQDAASGADHEAAGDAAGDLDELAYSVYEIIRRRLEVERERDWA